MIKQDCTTIDCRKPIFTKMADRVDILNVDVSFTREYGISCCQRREKTKLGTDKLRITLQEFCLLPQEQFKLGPACATVPQCGPALDSHRYQYGWCAAAGAREEEACACATSRCCSWDGGAHAKQLRATEACSGRDGTGSICWAATSAAQGCAAAGKRCLGKPPCRCGGAGRRAAVAAAASSVHRCSEKLRLRRRSRRASGRAAPLARPLGVLDARYQNQLYAAMRGCTEASSRHKACFSRGSEGARRPSAGCLSGIGIG